jgi:hypothetical protein
MATTTITWPEPIDIADVVITTTEHKHEFGFRHWTVEAVWNECTRYVRLTRYSTPQGVSKAKATLARNLRACTNTQQVFRVLNAFRHEIIPVTQEKEASP